MKLYSNPASPFARKCRVIAHELGIKLEEVIVNARDDESLRAINPLKKIPALVLDDGSTLFDSPVICEYLNEVGHGKFFAPASPWKPVSGRWKALGLQALGDGIMDAAVAYRYETIQAEEKRNPDHVARYMATIRAGLDALERVTFSESPTIGEITGLRARLSRFPLWRAWLARHTSQARRLVREILPISLDARDGAAVALSEVRC